MNHLWKCYGGAWSRFIAELLLQMELDFYEKDLDV